MLKRAILFLMSALLVFSVCACDSGENNNKPGKEQQEAEAAQKYLNSELSYLSDEEFTYSQLMGIDALGRKVLPTAGIEDKYVGIFYFVLLGDQGHNNIIDVNDIMDEYGNGLTDNPLFALDGNPAYGDGSISPTTQFHYWGKPLYGYYQSSDKWVVRRHLELFMNAGIDFLYLDYTNSTYEYDAGVRALTDVIRELLSEGYENVPRLAFMLPDNVNDSTRKVKSVYDKWYSKEQYADCWFIADEYLNPTGNPMVVGNFTDSQGTYPNPAIDSAVRSRLWLKQMQWPSRDADSNAFPWIEWRYPNGSQPNHGGIMNVSIAQHINSWSSSAYIDAVAGGKKYSYRARGWTPDNSSDHYGINKDNVMAGTNFEWQWQNALNVKDELKMVTVTGWNEWAAPKVGTYNYTVNGVKYGVFNDCFNMEFSRDAEMMEGGYGDNYYMQLVRNIREFKGKSIEKTDNVMLFDESSAVSADNITALAAKFVDIKGDAVVRTAMSVGAKYDYSDSSNRNNIVETRVGNDEKNLYVAVTCNDVIEHPSQNDASWMNVYISTASNATWEGFSFVIGRERGDGSVSIEKFNGNGSSTVKAGDAKFDLNEKTVLYTIPLSALGISPGAVIGIKATDNLQEFGNINDFYISGDSAPLGRLNYAYKIA